MGLHYSSLKIYIAKGKVYNKYCQCKTNIYYRFHHSKNAVDLLSKLLEIDPKKRIEVEDALTHPFFDDIRANHDKEQ